jgi:hypothetical protein
MDLDGVGPDGLVASGFQHIRNGLWMEMAKIIRVLAIPERVPLH